MKKLLTSVIILIAVSFIAISAGYAEDATETMTQKEQTFLESALPVTERSLIGDRLSDILNKKHPESGYIEDDEVLDVLIGLTHF